MCTVTYVKREGAVVLTSNRDESILRPPALIPELYPVNGTKVFFPKDKQAGGTWFAVNEYAQTAVLLNGAFRKHDHRPPYSRSRGLIVLEVIGSRNPMSEWKRIDLKGVEPFTLVLAANNELKVLRWDESEKHLEAADPDEDHIWSSVTLYDPEVIAGRKQWFSEFRSRNTFINPDLLLDFHQYTQSHDPVNGLVMSRDGIVKTQCITQSVTGEEGTSITYHDLLNDETHHHIFHRDGTLS